MGTSKTGGHGMKTYRAPRPRPLAELSSGVRRRKPRTYFEWTTLRRWHALSAWEEEPAGYLLREAREQAGLTQSEMGRRLGCSQQAIAQAERWDSNPTVSFGREWARAIGGRLVLSLVLG